MGEESFSWRECLESLSIQIVYFHESNSRGVVHATYNCGVIARLQLRNDRRLGWSGRSVTAVLNISYLAAHDDPTDDRRSPIIVGGNQSSCAIVQFQGGISQWIRNVKRRCR